MSESTKPVELETYSYSIDREHYIGPFSTREEAIEEAQAQRSETFWIAKNRVPEIDLRYLFDADRIFESIVDCDDDFELECAEDWPDCTQKQKAELTAALAQAFNDWMDRHRLRPDFWIAEDAQEHKLSEHDALKD